MRHPRVVGLALAAALLAQSARAEPLASAGGRPNLVWEAVEGPPALVSGPRPERRAESHRRGVRLAPGEHVTLRLPGAATLRVRSPGAPLAPGDIEIFLSDGSGLYVERRGLRHSDGDAVLDPVSAQPLLVRVSRPAALATALGLTLLVSRHAEEEARSPAWRPIPLPAPRASFRRSGESGWGGYWRLEAGAPVAVDLPGARSLVLETRLLHPGEGPARRSYRVDVSLEGAPHATFAYEVDHDPRPTRVDGRERAVGIRQRSSFSLPHEGGRLGLLSSEAVLVRLWDAAGRTLLLPRLNRNPLQPPGLPWPHEPRPCRPQQRSPAADLAALAEPRPRHAIVGCALQRLVRDNAVADGALLAASALDGAARASSDPRESLAAADAIRSAHTFHRDLLPVEKRERAPQRVAWFVPRRLRHVGERVGALSVPEATVEQPPRGVARGLFLVTPQGEDRAHVYALPQRHAPSELQVAVANGDGSEAGELALRIDDGPVLRLLVVPGPERPWGEYRPSGADADLAAAAWSVPIAVRPLIQAGTATLPLPRATRRVTVWRRTPGTLRVALRYRDARPSRLGEDAYRDAERRLGGRERVRDALVAALSGGAVPGVAAGAAWELRNHWTPLAHLVQASAARLQEQVAPPRRPASTAAAALEPPQRDPLTAEARALEADEEWLPALEVWGRLSGGSSGAARREAALGRIRALEVLGESYLARQLLRGAFVHAEDPALRDAALQRLVTGHARDGDSEALLALRALDVRRSPEPARLAALADALIEAGEPELALMLALVLPAQDPAAARRLARLALHNGWWPTYAAAVSALPADERRAWTGWARAIRGDDAGALAELRASGAAGRARAEHLAEGLELQRRLRSRSMRERIDAILAWEGWRERQPGERAWRADAAAPRDHAGGGWVRSVTRDLHSLHYKARPLTPALLDVLGPAELRLELRPLHAPGAERTYDGWVDVRIGGRLHAVRITGNRPSPGVELDGEPEQGVGRRVEWALSLGPGLHRIAIAPSRGTLLFRVLRATPAVPLRTLPPFSREALGERLAGMHRMPLAARGEPWGSVRVLPRDGGEPLTLPLPVPRPATLGDPVSPPELPGLDPVLSARLALRLGRPLADSGDPGRRLAERLAADPALSGPERLALLDRLGDDRARCGGLESLDAALPLSLREAICLGEGRLEDALRLPVGETDADARRRMTLLLRLVEERPEERERAQALGSELLAARPRVPELRSLHARLVRGGSWLPLPSASRAAGVREISSAGLPAEDPATRVRQALLAPAAAGERIIAGRQHLVLAFRTRSDDALVLRLAADEPESLHREPMRVQWWVDERAQPEVRLGVAAPPRDVAVALPAGRHTIRIAIREPLVNQFLRVRPLERSADGSEVPLRVDLTSRRYRVATRAEPLVIHVPGPAWVRVDEWRDGRTRMRALRVPEAGQTLEIAPEPGRREALLRLFQRVPGGGSVPSAMRPQRVTVLPFPRRPVEAVAEKVTASEVLRARPSAWSGHAPSWSPAARLERRVLFEEDEDSGNRGAQEFLELGLTRRRFTEASRRYDRSELLFRANRLGGPTLGLVHDLRLQPADSSLVFRATASAFLQLADASAGEDAHWAASLSGRLSQRRALGAATWHTPSVGFFARALDLGEDAALDAERVDRDVFTRYKAQHRLGLTLGDTLTHSPWVDTEWWAGLSLRTNENLVGRPDHVALSVGWRQLLGAIRAGIDYRHARFLADADRDDAVSRSALSLEATLELWTGTRHRLELGGRVRRHFDRRRTSAFVFFNWHADRGRGLRDFDPADEDFAATRQRRALARLLGATTEASR